LTTDISLICVQFAYARKSTWASFTAKGKQEISLRLHVGAALWSLFAQFTQRVTKTFLKGYLGKDLRSTYQHSKICIFEIVVA